MTSKILFNNSKEHHLDQDCPASLGVAARIQDLSPLASLPQQLKVLRNSKRLHTLLQVSHVTWPALGKEAP